MVVVYFLIPVVLIILRISAKVSHPVVPDVDNGYSRVFLAEAAQLYTRAMRILGRDGSKRLDTGKGMIKNRRLLSGLQTLYPGETPDSLEYRYRVELLSSILLVLGAGSCICLVMYFTSMNQGVLKDGTAIYRDAYGGMEVEADLSAGITVGEDTEEYPMNVIVAARVYSYEEADALFEEMSGMIDTVLLKDNDSCDHVTGPVDPVKSVDGYPFTISWESSDYELLDYDGVVHNEELTEPVIVTIRGDCMYGRDHWYLVRDLQICPRELTGPELVAAEISDAVERADERSVSDEKLLLPTHISSGELTWKEHIDDLSPAALAVLILIVCFMVPFRETEVSSRLKARARDLLIEYPSFVSRLTLYLGAGMSVRNCLLKLGARSGSRGRNERSYLDRELIISAHELEMGISENEVVERLGKRCGTREYMRFSALLVQNMKKGSTDLMGMLAAEADDAFELRKNEARKLGEEASTKLLLPMVMMLTVVMIIIMVPAYMSFSS